MQSHKPIVAAIGSDEHRAFEFCITRKLPSHLCHWDQQVSPQRKAALSRSPTVLFFL